MATANFDDPLEFPRDGLPLPFEGCFDAVVIPQEPQASGSAVTTTVLARPPENGVSFQIPILPEPAPETHIVLAFMTSFFCACPCGMMSLCHAIQVKPDIRRGNVIGAEYNSRQAWKWGMASVTLGSVVICIVLFYFLLKMATRVM
ncbi:uncharacterized protein LOC5506609 [Nematostella vectensis]|uniref:uncharacterized protein LOC5506609 n=1 Tax=Nematostella vectensis TaxID=45351 RepID=UPI00207715E0|nr:uncharacterized protein LOC5506609 [Nematostella vectensis]XP_032230909.2 uncharacterized protein LOC5506609 [Nematostella vectensis]XP_032230910.2 uncharacterized protein LOC5506609 [Nematostella vectensis]